MTNNAYERLARRRPAVGAPRPHPFWGSRAAWPDDAVEHVFLARAVDRLGQSLFGPDWIGVEFAGSAKKRLPLARIRYCAAPSAVFLAASLIEQRRPDLWAKRHPDLERRIDALRLCDDLYIEEEAGLLARSHFTDEEWAAAYEEYFTDRDPSHPTRQWETTLKGLSDALRTARLLSTTRPREGGMHKPIDRVVWDNENWIFKFDECQIDDKNPYAPPALSKDKGWDDEQKPTLKYIYVDRVGLDMLIHEQAHPGGPSIPFDSLPTYLKLMVRVASNLGIERGAHPSRGDIEYEIYNLAKAEGLPLSKSLHDKMTIAMRPPNSKKGAGQNKFEQAIREGEIPQKWYTFPPFNEK